MTINHALPHQRSRVPGVVDGKALGTTFAPSDIANLGLWYDWSQSADGIVSTISDLSGAGRTGTCTSITAYTYNGKRCAVGITADSRVQFTAINVVTAVRVYASLRAENFFLSDSSNYNFHPAVNLLLSSANAHASAKNGTWRLNGGAVNPVSDAVYLPGKTYIISCVTAGALSQNRIGYDRTYNQSNFILMEDLIWTSALSADQVRLVEQYLARKWGISEYVYN